MSLLAELQRRNVIRMAVAYLVFAWVVMQVLSVVAPILELPAWTQRMMLLLLAVGFVGVVVFSWIYELTPEGIKRESEVDRAQSITGHTARKLDIAVIVLLALSIGLFVYDRYAPREKGSESFSGTEVVASPGATRPENDSDPFSVSSPKSVAVLPFVNMSSDPEQTYFSDGISEELLNALVKLPGLKVAGRTSSFAFRDKTDDLRAIGKALNVNHILEGSVRKQGMRVRITAQLIQAEDGFHLWSETYDREVTDIFALQDEITRQIVKALEVELGQAHAPARTASIDAYSVYLKARQKLALRGAENLDQARALFQQAIELDPGYAPSYSGLARATELYWLYQSDYGYSRRTALDVTSTIGAVRAAAHSALGLDPDNAEAWSVLGHLEVTFQGDWIEAGRGHERALALRPNDPEILNFAGDYYYWVQDPRALETEGRAVALDPMLSVNPHDLALALAAHGDFAQALASAERAEALGFYAGSPSLRSVSFVPALIGLRRYDEARAVVERMAADPRTTRGLVLATRIQIAAAEGDQAAVERLLAEFRRREAPEDSASLNALALIWAGKFDEAAPWLAKATEPGEFWVVLDPIYFALPERLPDHAGLRAAVDRPELAQLFEIRRRNLALPAEAKP